MRNAESVDQPQTRHICTRPDFVLEIKQKLRHTTDYRKSNPNRRATTKTRTENGTRKLANLKFTRKRSIAEPGLFFFFFFQAGYVV